MTTNPFFKQYEYNTEQQLVHGLVEEAIKMYGFDIHYLPRTVQKTDTIFNEDIYSQFSTYYTVEVYQENVQGFEGQGEMLQQFGLTVQDEVTLVVAPSRFTDETNMERPLEGDLIYYPFSKGLFEIRFVEHEKQFYPVGTLPVYRMYAELFNFAQEDFDTGLSPIDSIDIDESPNKDIEEEASPNQRIEDNPFGDW